MLSLGWTGSPAAADDCATDDNPQATCESTTTTSTSTSTTSTSTTIAIDPATFGPATPSAVVGEHIVPAAFGPSTPSQVVGEHVVADLTGPTTQVLGIQITRSAPSASLARTGGSSSLFVLAAVGGALFVFGLGMILGLGPPGLERPSGRGTRRSHLRIATQQTFE